MFLGDASIFIATRNNYPISNRPGAQIQIKSGSNVSAWYYDADGTSYFPSDVNIGFDAPLSEYLTSGSLNIRNGNINLTWFQGYNNSRPAGYAGLDISTTGTPLICWDFMEFPNNSFNEIYPHYKNLNHFVYKSYEILTNKQLSEELSQFQFKDVNLNKNIDKNIYRLYEIYNQFLN